MIKLKYKNNILTFKTQEEAEKFMYENGGIYQEI